MGWFKRLFGFAEEVVTLSEKRAHASRVAQDALDLFDGIVHDLRSSADALNSVAQEAKAEAERHFNLSADAAQEANRHLARATKIAALTE